MCEGEEERTTSLPSMLSAYVHSRQDVHERCVGKVLQTNVIWSVHEDEEEICTASLSFIQFLCSSYAEYVVKRFCCVGQGAGLAGLLWNEVHPFNSIQW